MRVLIVDQMALYKTLVDRQTDELNRLGDIRRRFELIDIKLENVLCKQPVECVNEKLLSSRIIMRLCRRYYKTMCRLCGTDRSLW